MVAWVNTVSARPQCLQALVLAYICTSFSQIICIYTFIEMALSEILSRIRTVAMNLTCEGP